MKNKNKTFRRVLQIIFIALFLGFGVFNNAYSQTLSFTTSSTTLTESGITITNTSNSIPSGYRFKWEVSGGRVYCDSIGRSESSFEKNTLSFSIYPVTKYNSSTESITLTLKLMNQAGDVLTTTPFPVVLTYNPLTFLPQACTVTTPNIPCNIVCNPGFEVATDVFDGLQIDHAIPWMSGSLDPTSASLNSHAELYTLNNSHSNLWSSGSGTLPVNNLGGIQYPSSTYTPNTNYAGFISSTNNGTAMNGDPISQEFITTKLTANLIVGDQYNVNFEYSLGEVSNRATNFKAVVVFSATPLTNSQIFSAITGTGGVNVTEVNFSQANQMNLTNWQIFKGTFTAPANVANLDPYLIITGGGTHFTLPPGSGNYGSS